jgi:hypothetical protein
MRSHTLFSIGLATVLGIGVSGCGEKSETKEQTTIKTPEGTTTVTDTKSIKQDGKNPPAPSETTPTPPSTTK